MLAPMASLLSDAFTHHAWATRELLAFCAKVEDVVLREARPGAFGSILATFQHLVGSESYYRKLFADAFLPWDWRDDTLASVLQLQGWAAELADYWAGLLDNDLDPEAVLREERQDGTVREVNAGVILAQVLSHGAMHREQVSAALTASGIQPPDLDVWVYAAAVGRDRTIPASQQPPL